MPNKFQPIGIGMTPSTTALGGFIRTCRLKLGLRQDQLAERVGLLQLSISDIETGRKKYLDDHWLKKFAEILGCNLDELKNRAPKTPSRYTKLPQTEVGWLICSHREKLGLTPRDFAEKMGMPYDDARKLEISTHPLICNKTAGLLASSLDLDLSVFQKFIKKEKTMNNKLGELIRTRRKELNMTLAEVADKLGSKKQFINQIEFGRSPLCESDDTIIRLAEILQCDVNELMAAKPKRKLKPTISITPLGVFLVDKRVNLNLTQKEVSNSSGVSQAIISSLERGTYSSSCCSSLEKISKALKCEIPANLIPPTKQRKTRIDKGVQKIPMTFSLSSQSLADLRKIKELSNANGNSEVINEALSLLRRLLEKNPIIMSFI
jgi:transcriptional regulator with XRE-family HTH domain